MKKFNQVKIVLFDSTIAQFKLSVEAIFTRNRQDGSTANLAYVTDKGSANLNPSIYLVFSYKGATYEETKNLYTSYPQLFKIRKALDQVKDLLEDNAGFIIDPATNMLVVREDCKNPIVIANIGKSDKWMSISLAAIDYSGEDETSHKIPGVTLQLSDSEYVSVLTAEEILTIYTIIKDIDLTTIQVQLSSLFLAAEDGVMLQPVYQPQQQYQQPYQQPYQPQQQYQQPVQQQQYQQPVRQPQNPRYGQAPVTRPVTRQAPQQPVQPQYQQPAVQPNQPAGLPPRKSEKGIVNLKAVEETPVSQVSFNDSDAISDIFNDQD
jgi:hypothetical protein